MTTESFTPLAPYTIAGTGPYAVTFPYGGAADLAVYAGATLDALTALSGADWSISPDGEATNGDLTLAAAAASAHAGKLLVIDRQTVLEQGWAGTQSAREKGMETQLDRGTRHGQELADKLRRAAVLPPGAATRDLLLPEPADGICLVGRADGQGWTAGPGTDQIAYAQGIGASTEGPWRDTVAALLADTLFTYTAGSLHTVTAGMIIRLRSAGPAYEVKASGSSDYHVTTAGGIKLKVIPDLDGYYPVEAWGVLGDGSAGDLARLQAASDVTPYLLFRSKTYLIGEVVATPSAYDTVARYAGIILTTDCLWRSSGLTEIKVADAVQANGTYANDVTLIFGVDIARFAPSGFLLNPNADAQGYGAGSQLYGVTEIDYRGVSYINSGAVRHGRSASREGGIVTGQPRAFSAGTGTFAIGGKPGGMPIVQGLGGVYRNGRGGVNVEGEKSIDFGTVTSAIAQIGDVIGTDMDGDLGAQTSPMELVVIQDRTRFAQLSNVLLRTGRSASTARAAPLTVKSGQDDVPPEAVQAGHLISYDAFQGVYADMAGAADMGPITVDAIHAQDTRFGLDVRNSQGDGAGVIAALNVGWLSGATLKDPVNDGSGLGVAVSIELDTASAAPSPRAPFLNTFRLGGGRIAEVTRYGFTVRGVERFYLRDFSIENFAASSVSGGLPGAGYNLIEADWIYIDGLMLKGFAGTGKPLVIQPKLGAVLKNIDITSGAGTAMFFSGSGDVILRDSRFEAASTCIGVDVSEATFAADTDVDTALDQVTITGHQFRHGERVVYTEGTGAIGGLTDGATYYVRYVDENTVQLSTVIRGAAINLTSAGTGTGTLKRDLRLLLDGVLNHSGTLAATTSRYGSYTAVNTRT